MTHTLAKRLMMPPINSSNVTCPTHRFVRQYNSGYGASFQTRPMGPQKKQARVMQELQVGKNGAQDRQPNTMTKNGQGICDILRFLPLHHHCPSSEITQHSP